MSVEDDMLARAMQRNLERERRNAVIEECAKKAESCYPAWSYGSGPVALSIAAAIRALKES